MPFRQQQTVLRIEPFPSRPTLPAGRWPLGLASRNGSENRAAVANAGSFCGRDSSTASSSPSISLGARSPMRPSLRTRASLGYRRLSPCRIRGKRYGPSVEIAPSRSEPPNGSSERCAIVSRSRASASTRRALLDKGPPFSRHDDAPCGPLEDDHPKPSLELPDLRRQGWLGARQCSAVLTKLP
jgi:hypothetical protein